MDYAGFYINLDSKPGRRAAMETELTRHGLGEKYARFAGTEGNALKFPNPHSLKDGVIGCFASHCRLLEQNRAGGRHLHVVEDDAIFAACAPQTINRMIAAGRLDACDILYTDVSVPLRSDIYRMYKSMYGKAVTYDDAGAIKSVAFEVFNMKGMAYASAISYLVNRKSIGKLHDLCAAELARGPSLPVDLFYRQKVEEGALKAACLFPFVTSVNLDQVLQSSIDGDLHKPTAVARLLGRYAFFVDCDWNRCEKYAKQFLSLPDDRQSRTLAHMLAYSLTDDYRLF